MDEHAIGAGFDNDSQVILYAVTNSHSEIMGFYVWHSLFDRYQGMNYTLETFPEAVEDLRRYVTSNIYWGTNSFKQRVGFLYQPGKHQIENKIVEW